MVKLDYLKLKDINIETTYLELLEKEKFNGKPRQTVKEKFNELKKTYPYNVIFYDISFEYIILVKPENIECLISRIEQRIIEQSLIQTKKISDKNNEIKKVFIYEVRERMKEIFKYDKFQTKYITPFFTNNFNFTTCYYCNKDFILNFRALKQISTFQLDHFYDKGKYPYLALSFYNLIPSCSTCNSSKVKGSKDCFKYDARVGVFKNETCMIPNHKEFDFDQKVHFKLLLSDKCQDLHIKSKEDIAIPLKEKYSDKYQKYIEVFKLDERYSAHKDIVYDMMKNAELYPESRLKELQDLTGIPYQQIKKEIFHLIDDESDLSQEPFSKLRRDIAKELELL